MPKNNLKPLLISIGVLILVALGGYLLDVTTSSSGSSTRQAVAAGEHVASTCATATVPPITYSDGGTRSGTIAGASDQQCVTVTATDSTVTVTTGATTTVPTTTGATTTTPPPPTCTRTLASGGSLQTFVNGLQPGEIGCLQAGATFTSALAVNTGGFTLRAEPGGRASIVGAFVVNDAADNVTFRDLNLSSGGTQFTVVELHGDSDTFDNVDINGGGTKNCVVLGSGGGTSPAAYANDITIANHSRIHNCGNDNHEHGIYAEFSQRLHVVDSYIYGNAGYGIQFYPEADDSLVEYSVIDGNDTATNYAGSLCFCGEKANNGEGPDAHAPDRDVITNSLVTFVSPGSNTQQIVGSFPVGSPTPVGDVVDFDCLYSPGDAVSALDHPADVSIHDNVASDPGYTNRTAGDFTIGGGSPCAGKGPR